MKSKAIALLALALVGAAAPASAQEDPNSIRFSGTSMGCFGEGCTPGMLTSSGVLNFAGQEFDQWSNANGSAQLSLGAFWLTYFQGENLIDTPFTLFLAFTRPTGIDPDPVYFTDISGLVIKGRVGNVKTGSSTASVVFEPNVREYTFSGGQPNQPGKFTLTLNDTQIEANSKTYINGHVSNATVTPEPISMVLMGSGLAGIAAARRRRKKMAEQA